MSTPGRGFSAIFALLLATGCSQQSSSVVKPTPSPLARHSCLPSNVVLTNPRPFYPDAAQTKDYLSSYANPFVVGLRQVLDGYIAGNADDETSKNLRPFSKTLARDHFVVFSFDRGVFGGSWITVVFTKHPAALYKAWVYMRGGTIPSLYGLVAIPCTNDEQRYIAARYASMFALGNDQALIAAAATPTPHPIPSASSGIIWNPKATAQQPVMHDSTVYSHANDDAGCEDVSVSNIYDDGAIIELSDDRRLRVTDVDQVTSGVWVAPFDALLCNDDKLINKDDNESVELEPG